MNAILQPIYTLDSSSVANEKHNVCPIFQMQQIAPEYEYMPLQFQTPPQQRMKNTFWEFNNDCTFLKKMAQWFWWNFQYVDISILIFPFSFMLISICHYISTRSAILIKENELAINRWNDIHLVYRVFYSIEVHKQTLDLIAAITFA